VTQTNRSLVSGPSRICKRCPVLFPATDTDIDIATATAVATATDTDTDTDDELCLRSHL